MGRARGSEEARGVLYKAHGRILPQKSHTACGEKMTEQEKSTTIFVPLSYHGGGAAVKRFCGGKQRVRSGAAAVVVLAGCVSALLVRCRCGMDTDRQHCNGLPRC